MTNPHEPPPRPPAVRAANTTAGLFIGFFPAMMVIVLVTLGAAGVLDHVKQPGAQTLAVLACLVTLACAGTSSFILFRRYKKGVALAGAVLLLLINGCVAFFFGCSAMLLS